MNAENPLAEQAPTDVDDRALVVGAHFTLYLGLALGSFAAGPIVANWGYGPGFAIGGAGGAIGALIAGVLWSAAELQSGRSRAPALDSVPSA